MRNRLLAVAVAAVFGGFAIPQSASAALIGVAGGPSSTGAFATIIPAPSDVLNNTVTNQAQQGFDENQNVVTTINHTFDGGGILLAGSVVNSHMIFLNKPDDQAGNIVHGQVTWTFDGMVLGTMSDTPGSLEAASDVDFALAGTNYPGGFANRGLEGSFDAVSFFGNQVFVNMRVTQPGDWIRVVTKPIPEPSTAMLLGLGLAGLAGRRRLNA